MVVGRSLAVEQPELKQLLEEAPVLPTESLGEPARGVQPWEHWAVPNPDGKSWDVLQWYLEYGWGQQELFVIDLGTGQVKSGHPIPTINSVYLSGRALGFDGKYYIVTHTRGGGGLHIFIYDPGTNSVEDGGIIMPRLAGELSPIVVGPDGRIYGSGPGDGGKVSSRMPEPEVCRPIQSGRFIMHIHARGDCQRRVYQPSAGKQRRQPCPHTPPG